MKCIKCKAELRVAQEQVGVNEQNLPILKTFAYCDKCRTKYDYDELLKKQPKPHSALSVWALILSLLGCTSLIGGLLGIVDLCINNKSKKHIGSWFAIIFCALFILTGGTILSCGGISADDTDSNNMQTSETVVATTPSETVIETPASEEVVIEYQQVEANLLLTTLEENALRAENTYQDAYLEITGELSVIDSDGQYISITRTDSEISFINIQCYITEENQLDKVLEMNIGDTIIVKGQVTSIGEILGYMVDIHDLEIITE